MGSSKTSRLMDSPAGLLADMGYGKKQYTWTDNWQQEAEKEIDGQHRVSSGLPGSACPICLCYACCICAVASG
jgi:hypothetical protein